MFGEIGPYAEHYEDYHLLESVRGDESEVHGVGIVGGDEVEGEERYGENGDEAVDAGTLIGAEDLPPPD